MPASRGFGQWPETKWPWFGELCGPRRRVRPEDPPREAHPRHRAGRGAARPDSPERARADALGGGRLGAAARSSRRRRAVRGRGSARGAQAVIEGAQGRYEPHSSGAASWSAGHSPSRRRPKGRTRARRSSPAGTRCIRSHRRAAARGPDRRGGARGRRAPERQAYRWFSWIWLYRRTLVDDLVADGRLWRPEPDWVTAVESASG